MAHYLSRNKIREDFRKPFDSKGACEKFSLILQNGIRVLLLQEFRQDADLRFLRSVAACENHLLFRSRICCPSDINAILI
jgi:hypothetical protein